MVKQKRIGEELISERLQSDLDTLSRLVQKYRKASGLTQAELAKLAGVSDQFIRRIEKTVKGINVPSAFALYRISKVLDVDIEELLKHIRTAEDLVDRSFREAVRNRDFEKFGVAMAGRVRLDFDSKRSMLELLRRARQAGKDS